MFGLFGGGGHKDGEWKYDDIPTPANDDEIRAITDKTLESAVKLFKGTEGDGWKVVKEDSGIKLDEFPSSSGAFCTRVRGQIDGVNPKTLADLFYAGSVQDKQRYHPELHQQKIVREIDPNLRIMKTVFQQTGSMFFPFHSFYLFLLFLLTNKQLATVSLLPFELCESTKAVGRW
jgi:hypothetical protein